MSYKYKKKKGNYKIKLPCQFINEIDKRLKEDYKKYNRQKFLLFINLIERKTLMQPNKLLRDQWARLKAEYIKNIIGTDYKAYIQILMDKKLINRNYYTEGKSYDYSINYIYEEEEVSEIELSNKLQKKAIKEYNRPSSDLLRHQYDLLRSKSFSFDVHLADNWLQSQTELSKHQYRSYSSSINNLEEKYIYTVQDNKTGRIFTNFNLMKSDLRKLCCIDNETLGQTDLKSSQPYFLASMMLKEHPTNVDVLKFYDIVTNQDVYVWMLHKFHKSHKNKYYSAFVKYDDINEISIFQDKYILIRDDVKPEFLKVMFKDNRGSTPFQDILKNELPFVYEYIRQKKAKQKNNLALELQTIESNIFISAYKKMIKKKLKVLTVHDSIYFKKSDEKIVLKILNNEFKIQGFSNYKLDKEY